MDAVAARTIFLPDHDKLIAGTILPLMPDSSSMTPSSQCPEFRPVELTAPDGVPIRARLFAADKPARMTVLMLPGVGVPQRAFRHLATWMAERGTRCLTFDYRGIGESATRPEAINTATLLTWARLDVPTVLQYARKEWNEPVVLVAHSFGGQLLGLVESLRHVRAAALFGSGIGLGRYFDGAGRLKVGIYWHVVLPLACSLFALLPAWAGFGTRLPRGVAREWASWGRSPDWFLSRESGAAATFAAFDRPVLAYAIEDDTLAPSRSVTALLELLSSAQITRRDLAPGEIGVAGIGHVGFLKPGLIEPVWEEVLAFFDRHVV